VPPSPIVVSHPFCKHAPHVALARRNHDQDTHVEWCRSSARRRHARPERRLQPRSRDAQFVSLAGALSWAVSHTDRRVTDRGRMEFTEVSALSSVPLSSSALR
jgi:hypothetical protein